MWPITFKLSGQHVRTTTQGSLQGDKFRVWDSPALYSASWSQPPQDALPGIWGGKRKREAFLGESGKRRWGSMLFVTLRSDVCSRCTVIHSSINIFLYGRHGTIFNTNKRSGVARVERVPR